jgi:hypothetical protein
MDYLDHLGRVIDKDNRIYQINQFEKVLGINLPRVLRIFYLLYQVNDLQRIKKGSHVDFNYLVYNDDRKYTNRMALFQSEYKKSGYDPSTFYEFSIINEVLKNFFNDDYSKYEKEFIVIGETSWHFPLMIGIKFENSDKVYVYDLDKDKLVFLAENVFEYLMNIKLDFSNNYNLPVGKTVNDLYKNWNEDFWRVKADE